MTGLSTGRWYISHIDSLDQRSGTMQNAPRALYACFFLLVLGSQGLVQEQTAEVLIDAYPNTAMVEEGTTLILVCRVVGVTSTTVLSYQWTCPGGYCDAGAVDPEWAARIQQGNILVVNVHNGTDNGTYTCNVVGDTQLVGSANHKLTVTYGFSLFNEDGGLRVFFPRNSFVTSTTLTHTISPRWHSPGAPRGNDHIACYGSSQTATTVTWHNSSGTKLEDCGGRCGDCGDKCISNGGVGVDKPYLRMTDIHMYTNSTAYVNQDLECRMFGIDGTSAFVGVYLKDGVTTALQPPSITPGATTTTSVSVSWSQVSGVTGYYVSYQRQDLGAPPVMTPQYERIVGGPTTNVTLSGLEPGTTYRIRVWSTDGTSVSSGAMEVDVTTMEKTPSPPRMLTMIGAPTGSTVELNWLPPLHPNGAIHYEIEYEPAMTPGDPVNAGSSSSPYFTLTLPNEFLTYNVRVAAVNSKGQATSGVLTVMCPGKERETGPQIPTGLTVVVTGGDTAAVSWDAQQSMVCDVVIGNYSVRYQLRSGTGGMNTVYSSTMSVTLQDLVPNAEYTVSVAAINSNGDMSAFSDVAQFTVNLTAPNETAPNLPSVSTTRDILASNLPSVSTTRDILASILSSVSTTRDISASHPPLVSTPSDIPIPYPSSVFTTRDKLGSDPIPTYTPKEEPVSDYTLIVAVVVVLTILVIACTVSAIIIGAISLRKKMKGKQRKSQESSPIYELLYVPDQDSVQQSAYEQLPDNSNKDTPATIETGYAHVISPEIRNQPEQPQQHTSLDIPTAVEPTYACVLSQEISSKPEKLQRQHSLDPPATVPSTYSYVLMPEISQQPEQLQQQTCVGAHFESSKDEIKGNGSHTYQNTVASTKDYPEPPEVKGEHVYATVIIQNKRKSCAAGVTTEIPSPEMLVPTQPHQTMLQPVTSTPYNASMATPDHGYSLVEMMEPTQPTHTRKSPAAATSTSNKEPMGQSGTNEKPVMNDGAFEGYLKLVEGMHAQGKASFEAEFNSIDRKTTSSTAVAELNNTKNRYKNIFPYDSSRVVLSVPNTSGTDYINASFVDGYKKKDSYIASQAPVPETVDDFWQMMWDQNIIMVVMLTRNVEGTLNTRKSEDYYPESPGDTFSSGRFQIRTISLKYHVEYEVRVFEMAQVSDPSQARTLDHYLFTGWPDYGVPKYPTSLIRMLYHVRDARVSDIPILVHCSAGVGRTGTFIALDITLDQMSAEKTVDIKGTVQRMREKRMNMIQTVEQYTFVYNAVRELLLLGDTAIKTNDLKKAVSQHKSNGGGRASYQQQFAALSTLTKESADDKRVEGDPETIRYSDRAPYQTKHMYVNRPDSRSSVFINASLVDGYHAPRAFIAAQSPMKTTVDDFWNLIAEKNVQTVLLLCQLEEDSQDSCYQFWPAERGTLTAGQMKVTLLDRQLHRDFDTYRMTIQKPNSVSVE